MTDKVEASTKALPLTIASAVDANGQVTVWDHGPQPPEAEQDSDEMKRHEAEVEAWEEQSAGMPQPLLMDATTAAAAIAGDPIRFTLEPVGLDEGLVAERVQKIQDERAAKAKAAEDRIKALQLTADRKAVIAELVNEHRVKLQEERAAEKIAAAEKRRRPLPRPGGPPPAPAAPPAPPPPAARGAYPPGPPPMQRR
jgi:hypothetical protein